jgi:hypothetical protein
MNWFMRRLCQFDSERNARSPKFTRRPANRLDRLQFCTFWAISTMGPGRVKTCVPRECAELFSLLFPFDCECQCCSFPIQRNRDKISTCKFDIGVFTQPGSLAPVLRRPVEPAVICGSRAAPFPRPVFPQQRTRPRPRPGSIWRAMNCPNIYATSSRATESVGAN